MILNIHPIFVHFPIALLTLYALFELLRFKKLLAQPWFEYVKASFLIIGSLTSFLALQTGELAEEGIGRGNSELHRLVETHSAWASVSAWIFAVLAVVYLVVFINRGALGVRLQSSILKRIWNPLSTIAGWIYRHSWIMIIASLAGLIAITITGALGGAIVYGPEADPLVKFIYPILVR